MKILNLVLYSEHHPAYMAMRDIIREHCAKYSNVRTFFYMYDPTCSEPYSIEGDIIRIRGNETYVPGILNKTIEAFRITASWDHDIVIRSNISTLIDFKGLEAVTVGIEFGGPLSTIRWTDPRGGIFDGRFQNMEYICGWCMIFSKETIQRLLYEPQFIDTSIIDDVAISDFLLRKRPTKYVALGHLSSENTLEFSDACCIFRNLTYEDRFLDVDRMRKIVSRIHH